MKILCSICNKLKDRKQFKLGINEKGKEGLMTECYICRKIDKDSWRWDME